MTIDQILEGIEAELSLMRELGVRSVPFDRTLLVDDIGLESRSRSTEVATSKKDSSIVDLKPRPRPVLEPEPSKLAALNSIKKTYDFVFLHDKELTAQASETFEKIRSAMNLTAETAPLLFDYDPKTFPKAKLYIVMGPAALSKFMPGVRLSYFSFGKSAGGKDIHFTYSPEYFLLMDPKEKAVLLLKHKMWTALKNALQRFS